MPGYNHYSWCVCGWCYKTGSNGYSSQEIASTFDHWSAKRFLEKNGAARSWTACFVTPNASCPVCSAKVYFYQNQYGSRVFFDELGWPWPKHPCTDNSSRPNDAAKTIAVRARGSITEILDAAKVAEFDPNAQFRSKFGYSPWDLLMVIKVARIGFENSIEARSISPLLDVPRFVRFTSSKEVPSTGEFFGFDGEEVSILNPDQFKPKRYKASNISQEDFDLAVSKGEK